MNETLVTDLARYKQMLTDFGVKFDDRLPEKTDYRSVQEMTDRKLQAHGIPAHAVRLYHTDDNRVAYGGDVVVYALFDAQERFLCFYPLYDKA